jgi:hypothetical protein
VNPYGDDRIGKPDWSEDQHVLRNWMVDAIFPVLKPKGMVITPSPSPLTVEQIKDVFQTIAESNEFTGQTLITRTELTGDGSVIAVTLNTDGTITTENF